MGRCPHCGEYETIWINHNEVDEESPEYDESRVHSYCKNCDNGICEEC